MFSLNKALTIIAVLALTSILYTNCLDFHLKKTITLPHLTNIFDITAIAPNTIALQQGNLSKLTITLLTGKSYQTQLSKLTQTNLISPPKFNSTNTILLNKGNKILLKTQQQKKFTNISISGNLLGLPYDNVVFSVKQKCPTLANFNKFYQKVNFYKFGVQEECDFYGYGHVVGYLNRYIVYAAGWDLYIVDRNSWTSIAEYNQNIRINDNKYTYVDAYYDTNSTKLSIILEYQQRYGQVFRLLTWKNNTFTTYQQIFNPTSYIYLIGPNQGISIQDNILYRWHNFQNQTLTISNLANQSLALTYPSALSYNQSLFVQTAGNRILVYQMDNNFVINQLFDVTVTTLTNIIEGRIDQNSQYYIFSAIKPNKYIVFCQLDLQFRNVSCMDQTRNVNSEVQSVKVVINQNQEQRNLSEQNYVKIQVQDYVKVDDRMYQQQCMKNRRDKMKKQLKVDQQILSDQNQVATYNCTQWGIYSSGRVLISLCQNTITSILQLHAYYTDTLKIAKAEDIYFDDLPKITAVKLVKNQYKQQNDPSIRDSPIFLLIFKKNQDMLDDEAITYQYTGSRNFIRGEKSQDISFWNVYAYGNYIASIKGRNSTTESNVLTFFDFMTLDNIKQVPYYLSAYLGNYELTGYRNILVVNRKYQYSPQMYFYDLKKYPNQADWFRGSRFYDGNSKQAYQSFILPKKQIQYTYQFIITSQYPIKKVYSLSKLPIKQQTIMQNQQQIPYIQTQKQIFLKYQPLIKGRQCQLIFYISDNRWLYKYQDCLTQKNSWKYDMNPNQQFYQLWRMYQASGKQNVIIRYLHSVRVNSSYIAKYDIIEVRDIYNPLELVWKNNKTAPADLPQFINYQQNVYGSYVTIGQPSELIFRTIEQTLNASYAQFIKIQNIDMQKNCYAFSGRNQMNAGKDSGIYFSVIRSINQFFNARNIVFQDLVGLDAVGVVDDTFRIIKFSPNCVSLAAFTGKGRLLVWNTTQEYNAQMIVTQTKDVTKLKDIQFSGDTKLVVQLTDAVEIIDFTILQKQEAQNKIVNEFISRLATSKDGKYFATTTDALTVGIKVATTNMQHVRTFKIPQDPTIPGQSIISLSFDDQNQLFVTLSNGNIYVLTPAECQDKFINIDGVCSCRQNQTQVDQDCKCLHNFQPLNNTCICDQSQFVYQNQQCVCSTNASQVEGKCMCNQNFQKKGAYCECPSTFEYSADKITCQCNHGYVENNQCLGCSFPCSTCTQSGFNCQSYQAGFYVIIIGAGLAIVLIIIFVVIQCLKKKKRDGSELLKNQDEKNQN